MRRPHLIIVALLSHCLVLCAAAAAQQPATRPTTAVEPADCVTAECHASVKSFPVMHGPADDNACDACHALADAGAHRFEMRTTGADLCTYCHEFSIKGLAVVHKPVETGECLGCHDPHGGTTRAILREESIEATCNRCHESVTEHVIFAHAPAEQGACDSCHPPHAARFPKLLDVVGSDLCLTCHAEFEARLAGAPHQHKAMNEGCEKCHDPHGGAAPMAVRKAAPQLCLDCHEETRDQIAAAPVQHSVVTKDRACLTCHTPHFSTVAKLQPAHTIDVCVTCHKDAIATPRGTVAALPELADPELHRHGPVRDGECAGCHAVHGGERAMLLKNVFSKNVYERFNVEDHALCFDCHDRRLVLEEKTDAFTKFRNGDVNLHYLHANRDQRDRNCRVCHVSHAADNARLIRPSLPYGTWQLPIRFEMTESGGSCSAGCHRRLAYDRINPVPPATSGPAVATPEPLPPRIGRAQHEEDRFIRWSTIARDGRPVALPAGDGRPTVLAFVGSETRQLDSILSLIAEAVPSDIDPQIILVACGPGAAALADGIAGGRQGWAVVVDESLGASSALDVRGWPVILVIGGDGLEVARVAGEPDTVALKLRPYLQLAAGRIERSEVERQVRPREPEPDAARQVARATKMIRILVRERRWSEALAQLDRVLPLEPDSIELRTVQVEAMLRLNRAADAQTLLARIPRGALPPPREAAFRAEIAVAQQRWAEARQILVPALVRDPQDSQLNFLMGRVCEQSRDFVRAAEHYRTAAAERHD